MARKFWFLTKAAFCLLLILVAWNLFWAFKLSPIEARPSYSGFITSTQTVELEDFNTVTHLKQNYTPAPQKTVEQDVIHIAVVVCGSRSNETLVMMKSALIFSKCHIKFIIFGDSEASTRIESAVGSWPKSLTDRLELRTLPIMFPPEHAEEWKKLFKPCASQRLFLPVIMFYLTLVN